MQDASVYKSGVIVHALNSILLVIFAFPGLMQGPTGPAPTAGMPQVVVVLAAMLGIAGLISTYGAWHGQKWGVGLAVFTEVVNGLLALPGVLFAPTLLLRISAIISVLVAFYVTFALLRRPKAATV